MSLKTIIAANWKMYKTREEARAFLEKLHALFPSPSVKIFIAPPFTALSLPSHFTLGAQNIHEAEEGAYTGEVSARMVVEAGAKFVILGHSERRRLFHETDALIAKKLKRARSSGLLPLLCVGETLEEREAGKTHDVLTRQLTVALDSSPGELVVAYEPVWAIGSKQPATLEMAQEAHHHCRKIVGKNTPILYGGSVTPETAKTFAKKPEIDGVLVGGASLDVTKFTQIIKEYL